MGRYGPPPGPKHTELRYTQLVFNAQTPVWQLRIAAHRDHALKRDADSVGFLS